MSITVTAKVNGSITCRECRITSRRAPKIYSAPKERRRRRGIGGRELGGRTSLSLWTLSPASGPSSQFGKHLRWSNGKLVSGDGRQLAGTEKC